MDFNVDDFFQNSFQQKDFAVGNDIVFLPDFEASWNDLFRNKTYLPGEIEYCEQFDQPLLRYASTWAAKEAVYKAIKQLDQTLLGPRAIEIIRKKPAGMPQVKLEKHGERFQISLSISHDGSYIWAIALVKQPNK